MARRHELPTLRDLHVRGVRRGPGARQLDDAGARPPEAGGPDVRDGRRKAGNDPGCARARGTEGDDERAQDERRVHDPADGNGHWAMDLLPLTPVEERFWLPAARFLAPADRGRSVIALE